MQIKRMLFSFITVGASVICAISFLNKYWELGGLWFIINWIWFYMLLEMEHDE